MNRCLGILFLACLSLLNPSMADTHGALAYIGGVKIHVNPPAGFHEIGTLSAETRRIMESFTPPMNRLLGVFVSETDLVKLMKDEAPDMKRYMMVQTNRQLEERMVSSEDFQQLSAQVREQQFTLMEKHRGDIDKLVDQAAENFSRELDSTFEIKVGEQVPLGIITDQPGSIGIGFLGKYQIEAEGQLIETVVASGITYALFNNKLLYMYVYSSYESPEDIEWVKTRTREWIEGL